MPRIGTTVVMRRTLFSLPKQVPAFNYFLDEFRSTEELLVPKTQVRKFQPSSPPPPEEALGFFLDTKFASTAPELNIS
jgi:hypothetical protein